jgi:hypothetical protein
MLTVGLPAQPLTLPQTKTPATVLQSGGSTPVSPPPSAKTVPPPPVPSLPTDPAEAEALASVLRDLLKKNMPDPITKSNHNWGHQKAVNVTMHHHEGLKFWSETVQEMKNDGTWRRTDIRIPDRDKVTLEVKELTHPEEGKMLATLSAVAERVDLHFEQQIWHTGIRLYSGETRGHCKGALLVKAEVETKTEIKKGSFFPTVSLKLHVISAELFYEKLVVDHTAGLDGEAAKALGDLTISIIKAIKPHLEKDLLEKADAAIVKAAQSKELTVTLDKLMAAKKKDPPKKTEPPKK